MSDDDDFSDFANAKWVHVVRSAVLLGASRQEAEDLAQTTMLRCYVHWRKITAASDRDAYLMRMLLNEFARSRRRRWWLEKPTEHLPDIPLVDVIRHVEGADAIARALSRLGKGQRECVVLRHYLHMSEPQIAETLQVPVGTVKSRLSRAHRQLAEDTDIQSLRNEQTL